MAEKLLVWLTKKGGIKTLKVLSDHFSKVRDSTVELERLLTKIMEGDEGGVSEVAGKIFLMEEGCDHLARNIAKELQKGKLPPLDREDLLRLLGIHEKIIDYAKETAMLLKIVATEAKGEAPKELWGDYLRIMEGVVKEVEAYNLCLNKIAVNVKEAYKLKLEVERREHEVDEKYFEAKRNLHFRYGEGLKAPLFSLLKDILNLLELISDLIEDASDLIQVVMARVSAMLFASE